MNFLTPPRFHLRYATAAGPSHQAGLLMVHITARLPSGSRVLVPSPYWWRSLNDSGSVSGPNLFSVALASRYIDPGH